MKGINYEKWNKHKDNRNLCERACRSAITVTPHRLATIVSRQATEANIYRREQTVPDVGC
jgi:hypothetical protein